MRKNKKVNAEFQFRRLVISYDRAVRRLVFQGKKEAQRIASAAKNLILADGKLTLEEIELMEHLKGYLTDSDKSLGEDDTEIDKSQGQCFVLNLPKIGEPGTASESQLSAIEELLEQPILAPISYLQAFLLLQCRDYADAMINAVDSEDNHFDKISVRYLLVKFILSEKSLRNHVVKTGKKISETERFQYNEHFQRCDEYLKHVLTHIRQA